MGVTTVDSSTDRRFWAWPDGGKLTALPPWCDGRAGGRQMRRHRTLGKTRNNGGEGGGEAASHDGESKNDGRK
jgi:hypothetical protein